MEIASFSLQAAPLRLEPTSENGEIESFSLEIEALQRRPMRGEGAIESSSLEIDNTRPPLPPLAAITRRRREWEE